VSPSYRTPKQYERWHIRTCARCGRRAAKTANWPDGPICRTCHDRAARTRGRCPGCQVERLLPGRRADDMPICRDCAGITRSFFCDRCGFEGLLCRGRLCERCTLTDKLTAVLDDGTGQINPALLALFDALTSMAKPRSGLHWLRSPQVSQLLADLATGRIPLTHQALQALPNWRAVAYLRDLLMACGVLPAVDKQLLHVETWLHQRLADLAGHQHARVLHQFGVWQQLPRLRAKAKIRPLTPAARRFAGEQFTQAQKFLAWVDARGRSPAELRQTDVDAWHATHRDHEKRALRAFLTWAMDAGHLPRCDLPPLQIRRGTPITQRRRLELLRRLLTDDQGPLRSRVAACLMLLYAQPASRIVRLTVDDIVQDNDGQVLVRLGDPPTPVPEPFATLLLQAAVDRGNMNTAANPGARWLFPGRQAGQPLNPGTLGALIRDLGVPTVTARTAALRQLVLQAPAPVVAQSLGFHQITAHRAVAEAGGTWSRYAPGDQQP
jgi:integrase